MSTTSTIAVPPAKCLHCKVRKLALFQPLMETEIHAAQKYKSGNQLLPPGSVIYHQGHPNENVYTLFSGWVYLYKDLDEKRRQILDFALPGDLLGFHGDMEGGTHPHSAQSLTSVSLCVFPSTNLLRLFRKHPKLGIRLTWMTASDNALAHEHLASLGRRSARDRIAHLLLELFYRLRQRQPEPTEDNSIDFPVTQEMIGDAVGLTAIHVNRTLMELRRAGWIEIKSKTLTIPDPDALGELIGFNRHTITPRAMI